MKRIQFHELLAVVLPHHLGDKELRAIDRSKFEQDRYRVIVAKARGLGAMVHAVGGIEDHVRLVASVPPNIAIDSFIGQVKGNSSHFINSVIWPDDQFLWQRQFGVISFGGKQLKMVVEYVGNQRQHHAENNLFPALEIAGNHNLHTS